MNITAIDVFSHQKYAKMITDAGLQIVHEDVKAVVLSLDALKAISQYPGSVTGIFRNMENTETYTLPETGKALITIWQKKP